MTPAHTYYDTYYKAMGYTPPKEVEEVKKLYLCPKSDKCVMDYYKAMGYTPPKEVEEVKKLYLCPKSDKCVMDCHHKIPHEFEKFCDQNHRVNKGSQCPSCVEELAADITFFPEDFEIV